MSEERQHHADMQQPDPTHRGETWVSSTLCVVHRFRGAKVEANMGQRPFAYDLLSCLARQHEACCAWEQVY